MESLTTDQIQSLSAMVEPDRFSTGRSSRELHIHDISPHRGTLPAAIVWPESTDEISNILEYTYSQNVPVTPWGAGTSTEGNPVPTMGGLVIDCSRMDRIIGIRPEDLQADVQPGVLRKTLNHETGQFGLFFPPDPGADATIGGMIANNASGVQTIKYGATKDYVMKLTVVLPDGQVIHTGTKAPKSSSGYDLTRLFVGSEGTLGVVTEATLRLAGLPAHHLAATITFNDLESASRAVALMIGSALEPAALELLPPPLIHLMNTEKQLGLKEIPSLFLNSMGSARPCWKRHRSWPGTFARRPAPSASDSEFKRESGRNCGGPITKPGKPSSGPIRGRKRSLSMPRFPFPVTRRWYSFPSNW